MDRLDAMRLFVRIVERRSFTLAAHDLGIPRSTVTQVIRQLEDRLGVRLLQRTTRVVSPTGETRPLEFAIDGAWRSISLPASVSVTGTESYLAVALLGFGLFQVPRFHAEQDLARGRLIEILADYPPPSVPVSLLYPPNRQLSPRVRVFLDWAARQFERAGHAKSSGSGSRRWPGT